MRIFRNLVKVLGQTRPVRKMRGSSELGAGPCEAFPIEDRSFEATNRMSPLAPGRRLAEGKPGRPECRKG